MLVTSHVLTVVNPFTCCFLPPPIAGLVLLDKADTETDKQFANMYFLDRMRRSLEFPEEQRPPVAARPQPPPLLQPSSLVTDLNMINMVARLRKAAASFIL